MSLVLILVAAVSLPYAREPGPVVQSFIPVFETAIVAVDLLTAYLLWGQFIVGGRLSVALLGAAYLFSGLVAIPHLMVFPGALAPSGLLGAGPQSASWSWIAWHGGFPLLVAAYAIVDWQGSPVLPRRRVWPILTGLLLTIAALIVGLTFLITWAHDLLPKMIDEGDYLQLVTSGVGPALWIANAVALGLVVFLLRRRTMVQLWLGVAMLAALLDISVNLLAQQRFTIGWYVARMNSLFAAGVVLAALLHEMTILYARLVDMSGRLQRQATTDALSGLANRRQFDTMFEREWQRARREKLPLALLMIDIDHFKIYNDRLGHPEGDICIRAVARTIEAAIRRPGDTAARYGGEEFAVILPATDEAGMLEIAGRIRDGLAQLAMPHPIGEGRMVTISIGAACARPHLGSDRKVLLKSSDTALYRAKQAGRDRVAVTEITASSSLIKPAA